MTKVASKPSSNFRYFPVKTSVKHFQLLLSPVGVWILFRLFSDTCISPSSTIYSIEYTKTRKPLSLFADNIQNETKSSGYNRPYSYLPRPPFIFDKTIQLSHYVPRPWFAPQPPGPRPPAKILLTSYGWNHPIEYLSLKHSRSKRSRELLQAIVNHPWFDPFGWQDYNSGQKKMDPTIRYYVFLDVETCFESNYPTYQFTYNVSGLDGYQHNSDTYGGRPLVAKRMERCYFLDQCKYIMKALRTKVFTESTSSKLIVFECRGFGPKGYRVLNPKPSVALASISASQNQLLASIDQGLPPPPVEPVFLEASELANLATCQEQSRYYLMAFAGKLWADTPRESLFGLNNNKDVLMLTAEELRLKFRTKYRNLLVHSKFVAAPRGDNLFSYRFSEILSAGAIPVVLSDGWVLPFRPELIDWSECAVIIPEHQVNSTVQVLRKINDATRCKMRQRCYQIYQQYFATPEGVISGILEGLELVYLKASASAA